MISKTEYEHLKALAVEELTEQDKKDIKEFEDEIIKDNIDSSTVPGADTVPNHKDNFENMVERRNYAAQEAKEILSPVPEENEKEEKPFPLKKIFGIGLLVAAVGGFIFTRIKAQTPENLEKMEN